MSLLALRQVTARRGDHLIVERADLSIGRGELVCLLGPSGAGKTSLLRLCARLDPPSEGEVALSCRRLGLAFQEARLLPWSTVRDNVAFASSDEDRAAGRRRAEGLLADLGLSPPDFAKYPHELSGGMCQRVSLARLLIAGADLMLLDEPFSGLDTRCRRRVMDLLIRRVDAGSAVLLVTHDLLEAAMVADRVVSLDPARRRLSLSPPLACPRKGRTENDIRRIASDLIDIASGGDSIHPSTSETVGERRLRSGSPGG